MKARFPDQARFPLEEAGHHRDGRHRIGVGMKEAKVYRSLSVAGFQIEPHAGEGRTGKTQPPVEQAIPK